MAFERMTDESIRHIQRVGRDEANRRTSIGLVEFDALCEEAIARGEEVARVRAALNEALVHLGHAVTQFAGLAPIVERLSKDLEL